MQRSRLAPLLVVPCVAGLVLIAPPNAAQASADLAIQLGAPSEFVSAGSDVTYTLSAENVGDQTAFNAALSVTLPSQVTKATWTAAYAGGADGPSIGAAGPDALVTLPPGTRATFTIVATISPTATGEAVVNAAMTFGGETLNATDTSRIVPNLIVVSSSNAAGAPRARSWRDYSTSGSLVQLIDPSTGTVQTQFSAFEPGFRGGVQTAVGDVDGDGAPEVVAGSGPGRIAEIRVFTSEPAPVKSTPVAAAGSSSVSRVYAFDLRPFGPNYQGGVAVTSGDFNGDGLDDVAVARLSGVPQVKIYVSRRSGSSRLSLYRTFNIPHIAADTRISMAAGDFGTFGRGTSNPLLPDGIDEVVVAGEVGSGSQVQVRDTSRTDVPVLDTIRIANTPHDGIHVSVARVSKDGLPDLVIAQRHRKAVKVVVRHGVVGQGTHPLVVSVTAGRPRGHYPVFAAGIDTDGDGRADEIHVAWVSRGGARKVGIPLRDLPSGSIAAWRPGVIQTDIHGPIGTLPAGSLPGLVTTSTGLEYRDIAVGTGAMPSSEAAIVTINFTSWLADGTFLESGKGVSVDLAEAIPGLQEGISTMRVGGRRLLVIPPDLAYGASGRLRAGTDTIAANATLVFDVQRISVT